MSMTKEQLEEIAFWEGDVCLDCEAPTEPGETGSCRECGGQCLPAKVILQCVEMVESED